MMPKIIKIKYQTGVKGMKRIRRERAKKSNDDKM